MRMSEKIVACGAAHRVAVRGALTGFCLVLLGSLGFAQDASAGPLDARAVNCWVNRGGMAPSGTVYDGYSGSQYLLFPSKTNIPVPSQPTRGDLLFAMDYTLPALSGGAQGQKAPLYNCPPGVIETFASTQPRITGTDIYKTNFAGVGFRIFYYVLDDGNYQTAPAQFINPYESGVLLFPFSSPDYPGAKARIEVVATGEPISAGTLNTNDISAVTTITGPIYGALPTGLYSLSMTGMVRFTMPTCNVTNSSALNLALPDATLSALKSGTAGDVTSTTLQVVCTGGSSLAPAMSITGTTVAEYAATLSNQDTSVAGAKGVGLKLWVRDITTGEFRQPTMGVAERNLGSPVGALPTDTWSYQVGASYQQVTAAPTAGAVRANATLTFTYS